MEKNNEMPFDDLYKIPFIALNFDSFVAWSRKISWAPLKAIAGRPPSANMFPKQNKIRTTNSLIQRFSLKAQNKAPEANFSKFPQQANLVNITITNFSRNFKRNPQKCLAEPIIVKRIQQNFFFLTNTKDK